MLLDADTPALASSVQAVRYNYSPREQTALVELVAMIKTLYKLMIDVAADISPIIRSVLDLDLQ